MIPAEVVSEFWFVGKLLFILAFAIYAVFAGVVVRQVYLMTTTLEVGFEETIKTIAWAHFFLSLAAVLFVTFLL